LGDYDIMVRCKNHWENQEQINIMKWYVCWRIVVTIYFDMTV
jgi:hypothetical protein